MKEEKKKEKVKQCSNCRYASPNFTHLHCSTKNKTVSYTEFCRDWSEKHCEIKKKQEDDDGFLF